MSEEEKLFIIHAFWQKALLAFSSMAFHFMWQMSVVWPTRWINKSAVLGCWAHLWHNNICGFLGKTRRDCCCTDVKVLRKSCIPTVYFHMLQTILFTFLVYHNLSKKLPKCSFGTEVTVWFFFSQLGLQLNSDCFRPGLQKWLKNTVQPGQKRATLISCMKFFSFSAGAAAGDHQENHQSEFIFIQVW